MEEISDSVKDEVREIARDCIQYLEPICQECWTEGKDDPLVLNSGVNTPANKAINRLCDRIIDDTPEADQMWAPEIRNDIVELFYEYYSEEFQRSNLKADGTIECFYCYEERKRDDNKLGIRVNNPDELPRFHRDESDWM